MAHNRKFAAERILIGVPLTIIGSLVLVPIVVIAVGAAMLDLAAGLVLDRRLLGEDPWFKAYYKWVEHNGHRTLYGEYGAWRYTP